MTNVEIDEYQKGGSNCRTGVGWPAVLDALPTELLNRSLLL